jgi:hypothetical protein
VNTLPGALSAGPYSRQKKQALYSGYFGGDFSMGKVRKTYDAVFKKKAVDLAR